MSKVFVQIQEPSWENALKRTEVRCIEVAEHVLETEGVGEQELTILLTNDKTIREMNRQFRSKDKPTNVLAFPSEDEDYLGDIAISYGTCVKEAEEQGKTLQDHLSHLVVHAVLHLLGYDHLEDTQAETMESKEIALLATLGVKNPYQHEEGA